MRRLMVFWLPCLLSCNGSFSATEPSPRKPLLHDIMSAQHASVRAVFSQSRSDPALAKLLGNRGQLLAAGAGQPRSRQSAGPMIRQQSDERPRR